MSELTRVLRAGVCKHFADVAAGNLKSITVPAGHRYILKHARGDITTTATVANRLPRLSIVNAASQEVYHVLHAVVPASTGKIYHYAPGMSGQGNTSDYNPLPPDMELPAGYIIKFYDQDNRDAADTWRFFVEYDDIVVS